MPRQTVFAAWSYPGDGQIWSLHIPVSIDAITINTFFTPLGLGGKQSDMTYETTIRSKESSRVIGDIYINAKHGMHSQGFIQFEGAALVPFSPATARNDLPMFSRPTYMVSKPDGEIAASGELISPYEVQLYQDVDRISYWYARNAAVAIPAEERHDLLPHYQHYLSWCDRMICMVSNGEIAKVPPSCNDNSREDIDALITRYSGREDVRFVQVVGENLINTIRAGESMLEHMNQDGLLLSFYEEGAICSGPIGRWLARVLGQISHRFPGTNILEVGAGTGASTDAVLKVIGQGYASYTFTDISSGFFLPAEERFGDRASRMVFKTFDMEKEPSRQGFEEGFYDVVVAVNVLHISADLEASLTNVRKLLKPGGFLVVAELTSTDLLFSGMTVGTLPGWWIGADIGRPRGPLLTLPQWDTTLKSIGFGGIDTVTPDISASLPMSVFVAQAVDDKVNLLRDPLGVAVYPSGIRTEALAIIGGTTGPVQELASQMYAVVGRRFRNKEVFRTMEDYAASAMAQSSSDLVTVLCITDLDRPYLQDLTAQNFEALKALWTTAGTVLWTTRGSRDVNHYSYMMLGIIRTVMTEHPNLSIQMFDLDDNVGIQADTPHVLLEALLRHLVLSAWGTDTDALLWTAEPEVFVENGRQLITRICPDEDKNMRYNSRRRDVMKTVNAIEATIRLGSGRGADQNLELHDVSPLALGTSISEAADTKHRNISVSHSLLQAVAVGSCGFFRLCAGVDIDTAEAVLALSFSDCSPTTIPASCCLPVLKAPSASMMLSVAANLVAEQILALSAVGSTLLVHEPDHEVRMAVWAKAFRKAVTPVFISSQPGKKIDTGLKDAGAVRHASDPVFLHPHFPQSSIRDAVPANTAVFVHFSRGAKSDAVKDAILKYLPASCLSISEEALMGSEAGHVANNSVGDMAMATNAALLLRNAWYDASETAVSVLSSTEEGRLIALGKVGQHSAVGEPLAVVDWNINHVEVKVQPIDSGILFRDDRTYVFIGMAGELGQSLTGWMMAHGARHVVLTSRNPKINPKFVADMESKYAGAVVKAISVDITSAESLRLMHNTILSSLPPICGIVNGAMILDDELFLDMTFEQFEKVTKPKVLGTQLLDSILTDDSSLEFFIVATSIASVIGWTGQSNYSAANEFMTSLVRNRRDVRGVVGSAMSIPAVKGVGYAAQKENGFDFDYFQSLGYINISEEDLHSLFAEAILSGRPAHKNKGPAQVAMGINYVASDLEVSAAHRRDVKFSRFIKREDNTLAAAGDSSKGSGVRVKVQLESATTTEEVRHIVSVGFLAQLKRMLRLPAEHKLEKASTTLVELGVDSLVAVDVRSWFLKEVGVDVPTLKILGGGVIGELIDTVTKKLEAAAPAVVAEPSGPATPVPETTVQGFVLPKKTSAVSLVGDSPFLVTSPVFTATPSENGSASDSTPPVSEQDWEKKGGA